MLDDWLREAATAAGAGGADAALLSDDAVTLVLDLARDAAHGVERPAAPLAAFAAGLALGQTGGSLDDLRAVVERISTLAGSWES